MCPKAVARDVREEFKRDPNIEDAIRDSNWIVSNQKRKILAASKCHWPWLGNADRSG